MGTTKRERQKAGRQARLEEARRAQLAAQRRRRVVGTVVIGVVVIGGLFLWTQVLGGGDEEDAADPAEGFAYGTGECAPTEPPAEPTRTFTDAPQECIDPSLAYTAVLDTSEGVIRVALDTTATPGTVNNFVTLARYGYYDGTPIFRTDTSIAIIQGGDTAQDAPGPGYTIPDEGDGFSYQPGQLVMARTQQPDSAGAQWFFTAGPESSNLSADSGQPGGGTYVPFGTVVEGLDVVQAILALDAGGAPSREVTVNSVTIEEGPTPATSTPPTTAA